MIDCILGFIAGFSMWLFEYMLGSRAWSMDMEDAYDAGKQAGRCQVLSAVNEGLELAKQAHAELEPLKRQNWN